MIRRWGVLLQGPPCTWLMLCSLAFCSSPLRAEPWQATQSEAGFGGQGTKTEDPPDATCRLQNQSGVWVSCDEMLQTNASDEAVSAREPVNKASAASTPPPTVTELTAREKTKPSPFDVLKRDGQDEKEPPLVRVRNAWATSLQTEKTLRREGASAAELKAHRRNLRLDELVLLHLEELAYRRMQRCISQHRLPPIPKVITHRMTAAGPIPLTPAELVASGPQIEPYPCERVRVVDEELVDTLRRYYVISRSLHEDAFGWHQREERAALRNEQKALLMKLRPDDPLIANRPSPDWRARH